MGAKLSVSRASPPLSEPRSPPTASVLAKETKDGAGGSSGVLARIPASESAGPLRKRLRSALLEDVGDAKRIKDEGSGGVPDTALVNDDGEFQVASAGPETLLFSCKPSVGASDTVLGPSGSVQPLSSFKLDAVKHKIFLSHCSAQKDFVEQLCVDLERMGYSFPFFDARQHSLPKGNDYVPFIMEAAQLCHVAVIVLSKEFLCSRWPMIELAKFYSTQQVARGGGGKLKLLPLFFKLSVEEVKDEGRWMPIWEDLAKCDDRIDLSEWRSAVKALCKSNGLAFGKVATTEVGYIKCVVKSIFKLSPPDLLFGISQNMVGSIRMCEAMSRQFVEDSTIGARVLGIYGMAGLGKTMLAKALHDFLYEEFLGKVCYIDLRCRSKVQRQKWMLKMLCGFEKDMVDCIGVDFEKGLKQLEAFIKREQVFLIFDNITGDARLLQEVQDYLKMGFHPESKILITSSSKAILEYLLPNMEMYTPMPPLTIEEAKVLFLKHAAPMKAIFELTLQEQNILEICIQKCWFNCPEGVYYPVALKALANFFYRLGRTKGNQLLVWKEHLEKEMDLVKDVLKSSKDLYGILGLQFSTFDLNEKLLFLDLALFRGDGNHGEMCYPYECFSIVGWLCRLHDESLTIIFERLINLRNSGMVDFYFMEQMDLYGQEYIGVPDLYQEFAKWYAMDHKVNGLKNAWGVFDLGGMNLQVDSSTPKRCWSNLIRLRILDMTLANARLIASKRMQSLNKLVVLQLFNCDDLTILNLEGLDCLCDLELINFPQLVAITISRNSSPDDYAGIYCSLRHVQLENLPSLVQMPDLRLCTSLHTIVVIDCFEVRNFEGVDCPCLKVLWLELYSNHFEKLLAFNCFQSLEFFYIHAKSDVDICYCQWKQIVKVNIAVDISVVSLKGEGPCAKFLEKLCLLLSRSSNMTCTDFKIY